MGVWSETTGLVDYTRAEDCERWIGWRPNVGRKRTRPDDDPRIWYWRGFWRRRRAQQLRAQPLCEACLKRGIVTVANEVDHITPHRGDEAAFRFGPIQSLCRQCHSRKTHAECGHVRRPIGYALNGMPIWDVPDDDGLNVRGPAPTS